MAGIAAIIFAAIALIMKIAGASLGKFDYFAFFLVAFICLAVHIVFTLPWYPWRATRRPPPP